MKKILSIAIAWLLALTMSASTFDALWKQYEAACDKDLPETALESLRKIETKALKERRYGHYIAAMMSDMNMCEEVSPDSAKAQLGRLLKWQKTQKDAVAALVCRTILARYHQYLYEKPAGCSIDTLRLALDTIASDKELKSSLTQKDASLKYIPVVEKGEDSKLFNHDLFSLLCYEAERYDLLERHYSAVGNRMAACMAGARWMEQYSRYNNTKQQREEGIQRVDSLIDIYKDLSECGELALVKARIMESRNSSQKKDLVEWIDEALRRWPAYIKANELRNMRNNMVAPQLEMDLHGRQVMPDKEIKMSLTGVRNVANLRLSITPLKCSGTHQFGDLMNDSEYNRLKRLMDTANSRSYSYNLNRDNSHADYETHNDSVSIGKLPVGVYLIEATPTPGESASFVKKMKPQRAILRITDMRIVSLGLPKNKTKFIVVSATTGQPKAGATLHIYDNKKKKWQEYTTDNNGECVLETSNTLRNGYATTLFDDAMNVKYIGGSYFYTKNSDEVKKVRLFTDRAIYRPGQTVQVSGVVYTVRNGIETKAVAGSKVAVTLFDSRYNKVVEDTLTTDEYGTIATSLTLPKDARNGRFSILCDKNSRTYISVEEYVRPTYEVTIDEPTTDYHVGDTLTLTGKAKAYSGAGIAKARVTYTVKRTSPWWVRWFSQNETLLRDTIETDEQGNFTLRMPLTLSKDEDYYNEMPLYLKRHFPRVCMINAEASVTSMTGESHSGSVSIPLSNRNSYLIADIQDRYFGDNGVKMTINRNNARGKNIQGSVRIILDDVPKMTVDANKEFYLPKDIASGDHKLTAICEQDTLEATFVVFRLSDEKPAFKTSDWFYLDKQQWANDGKSVALQFGSSDKDVHVIYAIASGDSLIESGTAKISNSNITRWFEYKPEYGDGLAFSYAWTKDGQTYVHNEHIARPMPSKELKVEWKTFRNKLLPGQKEQWQMVVKDKNGNVSKASIMATMFDKSLDAIKMHNWGFYDPRTLNVPRIDWQYTTPNGLYMRSDALYDALEVKSYDFSHFNPKYMEHHCSNAVFDCVESAPMLMSKQVKTGGMNVNGRADGGELLVARSTADEKISGLSLQEVHVEAKKASAEPEVNIGIRTNFDETAFFLPQLLTDKNGVATLSFTLPESVTTWRIMAFAHDKDINFGMLTDEVVAQKKLMIQPRMPRFLRVGDKATLSSAVTNMAVKPMEVTVKMVLLDAKTEKETSRNVSKIMIKAGETKSVTFPVAGFRDNDMICKVTAEGGGFSDGEQHLLPVLSDEELVTNTSTFILYEQKDTMVEVSAPVAKATVKVDYTANPAFLMLEALPAMAIPDGDNAISLATALYANTVAAAIKDTLTYNDTNKIVGKLLNLQLSDGSFAWWKGMDGSSYMTLAVAKTLARMESITGKQRGVQAMMRKALAYLDAEVAKDVARMRKEKDKEKDKNEVPYVSMFHLEYLYTVALYINIYGIKKATAEQDYLIDLLPEAMVKSDMESKAMAAMVLSLYGNGKVAREYVESIRQHTVYRNDVGRYFDTKRALYSWCDYRIPTQTMAIEALRAVTPKDMKTIGEMQRWLLSSKRTQQWDTPYNSVNAVHAFFNGKVPAEIRSQGLGKMVLCDSLITAKTKDNGAGLSVNVSKDTAGESWVTAFVSYKQKAADVEEHATGIGVRREVLYDGTPKVGDRIVVRITIDADRDYDFVTITDNRAACLEPVSQLSGFRYGYYQEMKDNCSAFHYNKLSKGKHVIDTTYYVEREGTYTSGTVTAVCSYAPEFRGTGRSYTMECSK